MWTLNAVEWWIRFRTLIYRMHVQWISAYVLITLNQNNVLINIILTELLSLCNDRIALLSAVVVRTVPIILFLLPVTNFGSGKTEAHTNSGTKKKKTKNLRIFNLQKNIFKAMSVLARQWNEILQFCCV